MSIKEEFTFLVDLDGVCADIHPRWIEMYNEDYQDNMTVDDIDQWGLHNCVKKECHTGIYDYIDMPGFFYNAPVVKGCVASLKEIHDAGVRIIICTATPEDSPTGYYEKKKWVKRYLPFLDPLNFVSTHIKHEVRGDVIIDDGPHNLRDFPGTTIAFTRPWNRGQSSTLRVDGWDDVANLVIYLKEEKERSIMESEDIKHV